MNMPISHMLNCGKTFKSKTVCFFAENLLKTSIDRINYAVSRDNSLHYGKTNCAYRQGMKNLPKSISYFKAIRKDKIK